MNWTRMPQKIQKFQLLNKKGCSSLFKLFVMSVGCTTVRCAQGRRRLNHAQIYLALFSGWINSSRSTMKASFNCSRLIGILHYLCSENSH